MRITPTTLKEVVLIEPFVYHDARGILLETYSNEKLKLAGLDFLSVQESRTWSRQGVLRGLHYQLEPPQAKLITVVDGTIFDVAVDLRRGSPTFGRWCAVELSGDNFRQLLIPAGFAHGFLVTSNQASVIVSTSAPFSPGSRRGIAWDDPDIGIAWPPSTAPVLADIDLRQPRLSEVRESELPTYSDLAEVHHRPTSCFISYSHRDDGFVQKLYRDLTSRGISCWWAPEDMKIGDRIRQSLENAIREHERFILVLSESSVESQWVEAEVEAVLERERLTGYDILLPISIDEAIFSMDCAWAANIRRTRHIGNFSHWRDDVGYKSSVEHLVAALRLAPSGARLTLTHNTSLHRTA